MKKIDLSTAFEDDRGTIVDLIEADNISAITVITFTPGAVRANHYHKKTTQWNYVLSGEILLATKLPGKEKNEVVMKTGELYETVPDEQHALQGIGEATLMVFTRGPRAGQEYESDTFRLDTPLIEAK
jgi:quercetin dioxygenase-like cupin family protein